MPNIQLKAVQPIPNWRLPLFLYLKATLAALDAMRKAHQSEVQREVARFKQEFLRQVQRGEHMLGDGAKLKE